MKTHVRILGALLASALLAACGGGGGKTAALPTAATTAPTGGYSLPSSGARLTLKIDRSKRSGGRKNAANARSGLAAHRSPSAARGTKYISGDMQGLQVSITSGGTTQTYYYSLANTLYSGMPANPCSQDPTTSIETCSLVLPTVGPTESFSVLEVDQPAVGADPTTGLGSSIPSNANTLAVGSQNNVTITPGGYTDLSISMNPISAGLSTDCGNYAYDSAGDTETINGENYERVGLDSSTTPARLVVAANLPLAPTTAEAGDPGSSPVFFAPPGPTDADHDCFSFIGFNADGTPIGQPLIDSNGTPTALTITSSSSHLKMENWEAANNYSGGQGVGYVPEPGATPTSTVTIANSAEAFFGCLYESLYYDGTQTTSSMITVSNNLTATPPTFSGAANGNGTHLTSYAQTLTYEFAPISASPSSLTFTTTTPQMVTGTDPDAQAPMDYDDTCSAADGTEIASITTTVPNQFIVTPSAPGTCTFVIVDDATEVPTAISVTSTVTNANDAKHVAAKHAKGVRAR